MLHHYFLGHIAFRYICKWDFDAFFEVLQTHEKEVFLKDAWEQVCEECSAQGQPSFSIDDIHIDVGEMEDRKFILIEMPEPQEITHA